MTVAGERGHNCNTMSSSEGYQHKNIWGKVAKVELPCGVLGMLIGDVDLVGEIDLVGETDLAGDNESLEVGVGETDLVVGTVRVFAGQCRALVEVLGHQHELDHLR